MLMLNNCLLKHLFFIMICRICNYLKIFKFKVSHKLCNQLHKEINYRKTLAINSVIFFCILYISILCMTSDYCYLPLLLLLFLLNYKSTNSLNY